MTIRYIDQKEYRRAKTALTRAINSKDPVKVIATCRDTRKRWATSAWPDDWHRWARAYDDALYQLQRERWD